MIRLLMVSMRKTLPMERTSITSEIRLPSPRATTPTIMPAAAVAKATETILRPPAARAEKILTMDRLQASPMEVFSRQAINAIVREKYGPSLPMCSASQLKRYLSGIRVERGRVDSTSLWMTSFTEKGILLTRFDRDR